MRFYPNNLSHWITSTERAENSGLGFVHYSRDQKIFTKVKNYKQDGNYVVVIGNLYQNGRAQAIELPCTCWWLIP